MSAGCSDCKYESGGTCRRYPPRARSLRTDDWCVKDGKPLITKSTDEISAFWPPVKPDDWCGEFAP